MNTETVVCAVYEILSLHDPATFSMGHEFHIKAKYDEHGNITGSIHGSFHVRAIEAFKHVFKTKTGKEVPNAVQKQIKKKRSRVFKGFHFDKAAYEQLLIQLQDTSKRKELIRRQSDDQACEDSSHGIPIGDILNQNDPLSRFLRDAMCSPEICTSPIHPTPSIFAETHSANSQIPGISASSGRARRTRRLPEQGMWVLKDTKKPTRKQLKEGTYVPKPNWVWQSAVDQYTAADYENFGLPIPSGKLLKRPPKPKNDGIPDEFWGDKPEEWYWQYIEQKTWKQPLWFSRGPVNPVVLKVGMLLLRVYPDLDSSDMGTVIAAEKKYRQERTAVEKGGGCWYRWLADKVAEIDANAAESAAEEAELAAVEREEDLERQGKVQQRRDREECLRHAGLYRYIGFDSCDHGYALEGIGWNSAFVDDDYAPGGCYYESEWYEESVSENLSCAELTARALVEKLREEKKTMILDDLERSHQEEAQGITQKAEWAALCERAGFAPCLSDCDL